jgi:GNAT superfamily N-acetyltransferase
VRLYVVGDGHYVAVGGRDTQYGPRPHPRLPDNAKRFWRKAGLGESDQAVIARHNGELVGFFRYSIYVTAMNDGRTLIAGGTWVAPAHRRKGLATRMWKLALRCTKLRRAEICTATNAGAGFVSTLEDKGLIKRV